MIATLVRIAWTNLKRDRVAQLMTFLLPISFFSIFAMVFGNQGNGTARIRVAVVDEDRSEFSSRIVQGLTAEQGLRVRTTDRILSTRVGMGGLLTGKWVYLTLLGMMQLSVMFLWGRLVFKLDLFQHLPGFVVMTLFTSMAAAGFGLLLATIARTRAQLSGIGTIVILTMSSLGGSMFPRFLMSETMQKLGLATFNAWALDGYLKVFWRDAPIVALWPQVLVLTLLAAVFVTLARLFARRWETG